MKTTEFNKWLSKTVVLWQGEPHHPIWEVTDGDYSVTVDVSDGYQIIYTDIVMTAEEVDTLFKFVEMEEHDRQNQITNPWDIIDDWEHGLYGYGN